MYVCAVQTVLVYISEFTGTKFHMEVTQYNLKVVSKLDEVRNDDFTSTIIHWKAKRE
jgi:hypothetical protein